MSKFDPVSGDLIEEDSEVYLYDKFGCPTDNENLSVCCVNEDLLFIKFNKNGHVFDPYDLYYNEGDEGRFNYQYGELMFTYHLIREKETFDLYLKYLKTKKQSFFNEFKRRIV